MTKPDIDRILERLDHLDECMHEVKDEMGKRFTAMDGRLDRMDGRLDQMDKRFDRMDGRLTDFGKALGPVNAALEAISKHGHK